MRTQDDKNSRAIEACRAAVEAADTLDHEDQIPALKLLQDT